MHEITHKEQQLRNALSITIRYHENQTLIYNVDVVEDNRHIK